MMMQSPKISLVSLGCAKNLVDSEKMLGLLAEAGCALTSEEDGADVLVINTCGFLDASRVEADEVIAEALELKAQGKVRRVVVAGCLVQRDGEAIRDRLPGIDALVGVNNRDDIVRAVKQGLNGTSRPEPSVYLSDYHPFTQIDTARLRLTPPHYAYLRISEGCDQLCTFCTIPSIRGKMHCKPPEAVLVEARELIADGAKELILIGQDTTSYGLGADGIEAGLAGLLRQLNELSGLQWIRLMYVYPSVMTDDIIDAIGECERVCNYVDIPLQHISDRVLKSMHRRIDRAGTERLVGRIRDRIPGVTLRTTMIVGFPGETDAEFQELHSFINDFQFDALGCFQYSREQDTPAGRMKQQVPKHVKQQRYDELMSAQQGVAFGLGDRRIGTQMDVLVDGHDDAGRTLARHQGQAPEVDGITFIKEGRYAAGEVVGVRCVAREHYDLVATPLSRPLPILNG